MSDSSDYARRIDMEIRRGYMKHLHEIERHYDVIYNAIAIIKARTAPQHHWTADRLEKATTNSSTPRNPAESSTGW